MKPESDAELIERLRRERLALFSVMTMIYMEFGKNRENGITPAVAALRAFQAMTEKREVTEGAAEALAEHDLMRNTEIVR